MFDNLYAGNVPSLTTEQMIEVDRAMIEDYRIELIQMMENAGRNLARLAAIRFMSGDPPLKKVIILAGSGGNGGGALVCARHLHNYGTKIKIFTTKSSDYFTPVAGHQLDIAQRMGIPISFSKIDKTVEDKKIDLIIDGIIGYSLKGAPRGMAASLIRWANSQDAPILALDTPSGLDATLGVAHEPTIKATATMTLALPKDGLRAIEVIDYIGELYLADISVPPKLYANPPLSINIPNLFSRQDIIRLR